MSRKTQSGFTLVEIAIVLVIVGLLLGAVLKGQELIFNSKVKATFNMARELSVAFAGYQDRYKQLPGDDPQAASRFPAADPAPVNGNGNGLVPYGSICSAASQAGEGCQALYHLRLAGFLTGSGALALQTPFGVAVPATASQFITNGGSGQALAFLNGYGVTHKIMSAIDTAYDDGNPATGTVRCQTITAYNMSTPEANIGSHCVIMM
ncbi:MAG: type II secretion system protein [Lautropia sp.]